MALLQLLHEAAPRFRWQLVVAHLNHGIRGKAAAGDAAFVAGLARSLRLPCHLGRARVPALAKREGISLEMAARRARYAFLARTALKVKADVVATAHTADDQVETLLLKLVRGAGNAGLRGMQDAVVLNGVNVVRPLLKVSRRALEQYLHRRRIVWREDESNRDPAFLRNRVRHELLPLLERHYNPGIRAGLLRTREILAAEEEWMDGMARRAAPEGPMTCATLMAMPLAMRRRVVRLWLVAQGIPDPCLDFEGMARVNSLLGRSRGRKTVALADGWQVRRQYERIEVLSPATAPVATRQAGPVCSLAIPGETRIPVLGLRVLAGIAQGIARRRGRGPGVLPAQATLSAAKLAGRPLRVRTVKRGDRIAPFGMAGSRKLQDILVDAKVPVADRSRIPVVECEGEIVWVPGYRIARDWAAPDNRDPHIQLALFPLELIRGAG